MQASLMLGRFLTFLTGDYDLDALSRLNPERFTVDDIRVIFRLRREWSAKSICDTAVRQGVFEELEPGVYRLVERI